MYFKVKLDWTFIAKCFFFKCVFKKHSPESVLSLRSQWPIIKKKKKVAALSAF